MQSDERELYSPLPTMKSPSSKIKTSLIQQLPSFVCCAGAEAGDESIDPQSQRCYRQNEGKEEM